MPKYVIEREIPGAGRLTAEQLQSISQTSCGVLLEMGPSINWVHSYVTDDKIYCITSRRTRRWCASTRSSAAFRRTRYRRCST